MQILIAEDDLDISALYKKALEKRKHSVVLTYTGEACLENYLNAFRNTKSAREYDPEVTTKKTKVLPSSTSNESNSRYDSSNKETAPLNLYDVVILDYKMPGMNGMDVAKEILAINPHQRIIFASAYAEETLRESVKQLKQVVELMQKPFSLSQLVDAVEDKEVYEELKSLDVDVNRIRTAEPSHQVVIDLLERLKKIQKYRTF